MGQTMTSYKVIFFESPEDAQAQSVIVNDVLNAVDAQERIESIYPNCEITHLIRKPHESIG